MTVAVYDANILASGFVSGAGPSARILDAWRVGRVTLVVSDHILSELERTLQKRYFLARLAPEQVVRFLDGLRRDAVVVAPTVEVHGVASHPEDDVVLSTALSARAGYLVTGDRQLRQLGSYQGVTIIGPRVFLDRLTAE